MRNKRTLTIVVGVLVVAIVAFVAVGLIFKDSWPAQVLQGAGFLGAPTGGRVPTGAAGGEPTYVDESKGVYPPVVDGNTSDWDLSRDFFADLYRAGDPTKKIEAKLYLRYDCGAGIMYAFVASAGDWPLLAQSGEAWIAINGKSNKVSFVSFAWVGQGYDGDSGHATGWEASFSIAQGTYALTTHVNAFDGGESQTSEVADISLVLDCYKTTAVFLNYFTAERAVAATARGGSPVTLRWETATEVDNVGFNVYRGLTNGGPWTKLNSGVIPSQVAPGSPVGAAYEWVDSAAPTGAVYYLLEDVDTHGVITRHGPVQP
jgi:hypothetical protein